MIFINYRAQEQAGYAALLDRELAERFGPDAVFRASRSIPPGADFTRDILDSLQQCQVLLAVMGPSWLAAGRRCGTAADGVDWVHREIAEAFVANVRVIPILVEDAGMPSPLELSADIADLVRCQYLRLHHRSIGSDIERLVDELIRLVPELAADRHHPYEFRRRDVRLYRVLGNPAPTTRIGLVTGTIRRVRGADIWVNSENTDMEMARITEFSISGIIRYWGARRDQTGRVVEDTIARELAAAVGDRRPVAPAAAFVTGAGALTETNNVHHVIHVAAVQGEPGAGFRQIAEVGRCVTAALTEAERLARAGRPARTILIPLLGTGMAAADTRRTASALLCAALDHVEGVPRTALRMIYFLAYSDRDLAALTEAIRGLPLASADEPDRRAGEVADSGSDD